MPNLEELLLVAIVGAIVLTVVLGTPLLAIIALVRSRRVNELSRRLEMLEAHVAQLSATSSFAPPTAPVTPSAAPPSRAESPFAPSASADRSAIPPVVSAALAPVITDAVVVPEEPTPATSRLSADDSATARTATDASNALELMIGSKALGWVAVVVLLFATGFFLRYAYDNEWIGPVGQVSIGVSAGLALLVAGWKKDRQGWRIFSRMLTSGGIVVLYVSTFSAFGFYHLVPQSVAAVFLAILVAESALLALSYDSVAIGVMAVVGGLLTPLLMHSDHDQYVSLFVYLGILTAGSLALLAVRPWPVIGTLALVGTQGVYWGWYVGNYHPEKLAWAMGFQAVVFALHWGQGLVSATVRREGSTWEDVARSSLNAGLTFGAMLALLEDRHSHWQSALAMLFAGVYAVTARVLIAHPERSRRMLLVAVGISSGFIALAFPLEASASWVALGWSVQAAVLWWFGIRVEQRPLRLFAAALAIVAAGRIAFFDIPRLALAGFGREPYVPVANLMAAPALAAIACLLVTLVLTRSRGARAPIAERVFAAVGFVVCLLLVWYLVSVDLFEWFRPRDTEYWSYEWRRRASMWLSTWWAVYASTLLAVGFAARVGLLRWTALALYALTVGKVFLVDMAGLDQIYRIVAFFVLAVFLGLAAWAYQRFGTSRTKSA